MMIIAKIHIIADIISTLKFNPILNVSFWAGTIRLELDIYDRE